MTVATVSMTEQTSAVNAIDPTPPKAIGTMDASELHLEIARRLDQRADWVGFWLVWLLKQAKKSANRNGYHHLSIYATMVYHQKTKAHVPEGSDAPTSGSIHELVSLWLCRKMDDNVMIATGHHRGVPYVQVFGWHRR